MRLGKHLLASRTCLAGHQRRLNVFAKQRLGEPQGEGAFTNSVGTDKEIGAGQAIALERSSESLKRCVVVKDVCPRHDAGAFLNYEASKVKLVNDIFDNRLNGVSDLVFRLGRVNDSTFVAGFCFC